jgi:hypothetical protein
MSLYSSTCTDNLAQLQPPLLLDVSMDKNMFLRITTNEQTGIVWLPITSICLSLCLILTSLIFYLGHGEDLLRSYCVQKFYFWSRMRDSVVRMLLLYNRHAYTGSFRAPEQKGRSRNNFPLFVPSFSYLTLVYPIHAPCFFIYPLLLCCPPFYDSFHFFHPDIFSLGPTFLSFLLPMSTVNVMSLSRQSLPTPWCQVHAPETWLAHLPPEEPITVHAIPYVIGTDLLAGIFLGHLDPWRWDG